MRNVSMRAKWMWAWIGAGAVAVGALPGKAYGQVLNEDFKLLASDGAQDDRFGWSIAIADGVVAVGTRNDGDNGIFSGSAYLFDAATGTQLHKLLAGDGAAGDLFGTSIAIADGIVAVGAYEEDGSGHQSGSAYLFDAATGAQLHKLLAFDGADWDYFGYSIAIADGIVAIGAWRDKHNGLQSGSAYLFDAATGTQLHKLLANDGARSDSFGSSIAIANGIVAVGASADDDNGDASGSAYLFDAATGTQLHKLLASDGAETDLFGTSIAIADGIVAVGAYGDDDNGSFSGSAYLFDVATGTQLHKLLPTDGAATDHFGLSIAIADGVVAVGAFGPGSAYLFDAATGTQLYKLLASDGVNLDGFGVSIAITEGTVAVGATGDDDNGSGSGSAYLFNLDPGPKPCLADLNGDGFLNISDVTAFIDAFIAGDPLADLNDDGFINISDVTAFIDAFTAGC